MTFQIVPLTADRVDACAALFEAFPYKRAQQSCQRLDRERLNVFYLNGLRQSVERGDPLWLALSADGAPAALAGLAGDGWHSGVYGLKMGKIQPWLNTLAPEAGEPLLEAALAEARARGMDHLSARIDGEDFVNLHRFEQAGFLLVDVSLKLSRPMPVAPMPPPAAAQGLTVGLAGPEDHGWIRAIGSTTHGGTHFLNDPSLPREKTQALFSGWLERCLNGLAYRVHTLKTAAGDGAGFVTYLRAPSFARAVGPSPIILDFVLLDPARRGGGLGPWFIAETLAREANGGFDYCELRTSAHNLPAVLNYEKIGFRCCAADFTLHCRLG